MDALIELKRKLDTDLKYVRGKLRDGRKAAKKVETQWVLRGHEHDVAMCIYLLTDCGLEPTAKYLTEVAHKHDWSSKDDCDIHDIITDNFAAAPEVLLLKLLQEDCDEKLAVRREARKYVLEWSVVAWTRAENTKDTNPVAPSTFAVLDKAECMRLAMPGNERPRAWGVCASGAARKKAFRLRAKYNGRIGKLKPHVHVPMEDMQVKTAAAWQWFNHLNSNVPAGKRVLRLNWDETAICLFPDSRGGNLFIAKEEQPALKVKHNAKRAYLTHVAVVCDDPVIQKLLPQVIIGNKHTLLAKDLPELQSKCPATVRILRNKSAWVNADVCVEIVRLIAEALKPFKDEVQALLLFDTHPAHIHACVFNACSKANIWPHLVPSQMTWFLQPLDTEGFAAYKLRIQREYQDYRTRCDHEIGDVRALLCCVYAAMRDVLNVREWAGAFDRNGFATGQLGVKEEKLRSMGACLLAVPSERPTLSQLQSCFPRNRKARPCIVWRCVDAKPTVAKHPASASASSSSAVPPVAVDDVAPIASRTRSKGKAAAKT